MKICWFTIVVYTEHECPPLLEINCQIIASCDFTTDPFFLEGI